MATVTTPELSNVITYVRRILKQPNQQDISDSTITDYVNRFYIYDMPARIQLFDLKTQYSLELQPNVDQYNAPITILPGGAVVPTYNVFETPAFMDGYKMVWQQSTESFQRLFPNFVQNNFQQSGTASAGPYTITIANGPILQGHRDQNIQPASTITSSITNITQATQAVVTAVNSFLVGQVVAFSGVLGMTQLNGNSYSVVNSTGTTFTININSTAFGAYTSGGVAIITIGSLGLLTSNVFVTATDVNGNLNVAQDDPLSSTTGNLIQYDPLNPGNPPRIVGTVNYLTGLATVTFLYSIPTTSYINSQSVPYSAGRPQAVLFFDNTFTFRPVPSQPFLFRCDAYYTPAAFITTNNFIPYRWMSEYLARGAARKILTDYGDMEQLGFYEPYFREQENFVLRRTTRQNSVTRVSTIYTGQVGNSPGTNSQM
jgi:hypothetical protein